MAKRYDPKSIELKWQKRWMREKTYEPDLARAKRPAAGEARRRRPFYNLMMFPYPSAEGLHVGNVYAFTGADIFGRFQRMRGHDVFEPIGLDGFGIHSENYALKINKHPADQAKVSEKNFYRQLAMIGNGFAWQERLETYDPGYYRWTQWIFAEMFRRGLAYRKKSPVNWCPSCMTVLADEQVIQKSQIPNSKPQTNPKSQIPNQKHKTAIGVCERCETPVGIKELEQWFFKITDYAERLLKNLDRIDWSERIKIAQRNWIGRSEGAAIRFNLIVPGQPDRHAVEVFTTRPDTLFGATFLAVSPELARRWLDMGWPAGARVKTYIRKSLTGRAKPRDDAAAKTGVFMGVWAKNPATGKKIPVWAADYVLAGYGTGAIMGVPAHDERDFEFAKKYKLPIREVIEPVFTQTTEPGKVVDGLPLDHRDAIIAIVKHWSEEKFMGLKWKEVAWGTFVTGGIEQGQTAVGAARAEIREETGFLHPQLIADFGVVHGKFYHVPKRVNRFAHARVLYFELQDGKHKKITEEERNRHEVLWFTKRELEKFLTPDAHQRALELLNGRTVYTGEGIMKHSGTFDGMDSERAKWAITKAVGGKRTATYRLRDWLISRQRYWGPPIPLIFCENCKKLVENSKFQIPNSKFFRTFSRGELGNPGWIAVPEKDLPVQLPRIKNFRPTGTERSPLATVEKFWKVRCPKCRAWARRETDVSDTFLDSAWYYIGYLMKFGNWKLEIGNSAFSRLARKWLPVDMYIGGAEHAVLHLLYVRFLAMVFYDWKMLSAEEPFKRFRAHGLLIKDGAKMSKSRGNVVNPDEYVRAYGADALRMYLMFLGPFEQGGDFRDTGIRGITRFLERVWRFYQERKGSGFSGGSELDVPLHRTIAKVTADVEHLQYNTAISALMVLLNAFEERPDAAGREHLSVFLRLLAPFAPHITEELWHAVLGEKKSIHVSRWPEADPRFLRRDRTTVVIQVNGRVRDRIEVEAGASEASVRKAALGQPKVKELVGDQSVRKFIYVPGRIANIVI